MRLLIFSVLFVFIVFKSFAMHISLHGGGKISCSDERFKRPLAEIRNTSFDSGWEDLFVYPIRICVYVYNIQSVQPCELTGASRLSVQIGFYSREKCEPITIPLKAEHFKASGMYCHVFTVSEIADHCRGKNLTDTKINVQALFYGNQESGKPEAHIHVHAHMEEYYFKKVGTLFAESAVIPDEPGEGWKPVDVGLHAVVCSFPNCKVRAEKPTFIANKTERFRIVWQGDAPIYVPEKVPLSHHMFSVSYFYCYEGICPSVFKARIRRPTSGTIGHGG